MRIQNKKILIKPEIRRCLKCGRHFKSEKNKFYCSESCYREQND